MFERDYIMRMVKQFSELLAVLSGLRKDRKWDEALVETEEFMKRHAMPNRKLLHSLSIPAIIDLMTFQGLYEFEKIWVTARLFQEESKRLTDQGAADEAEICAVKSLGLFLFLHEHRRDVSDDFPIDEPLRAAAEAWKGADWPLEISMGLLKYYENSGEYALAEDVLFDGLERGLKGLRQEGMAFYERLIGMPDDKLRDGGLPRSEVEESFAELRGRLEV